MTASVIRGVRRVATAVGVAGVLCATVLANPAQAYVPAPALGNAVNNHHNTLFWNNFSLWDRYFSFGASNGGRGPDGIPGPDGTPDGRGAFMHYSGWGGESSIYAFERVGPAEAYAVYGPIRSSWAALGWENGQGYPIGDLLVAGTRQVQDGCAWGDQYQYFKRVYEDRARVNMACTGSSGVRWFTL